MKLSQPSLLTGAINPIPNPSNNDAPFIVRVTISPTGAPLVLFNTHRFNFEARQPLLPIDTVTEVDRTPNPIPRARLCKSSPAGNPNEYVALNTYKKSVADISAFEAEISRVGLQFHFPLSDFAGEDFTQWSIRGENLCAWEQGITPPLKNRQIAIDPVICRAIIGIDTLDKQQSL